MERLKERLFQIRDDEEIEGFGLKAALTKNFIQNVEENISKMKNQNSKE